MIVKTITYKHSVNEFSFLWLDEGDGERKYQDQRSDRNEAESKKMQHSLLMTISVMYTNALTSR